MGFEPTTTSTQSSCTTGLCDSPSPDSVDLAARPRKQDVCTAAAPALKAGPMSSRALASFAALTVVFSAGCSGDAPAVVDEDAGADTGLADSTPADGRVDSGASDSPATDAPTDSPATDAPTDSPATDAPADSPATDAPADSAATDGTSTDTGDSGSTADKDKVATDLAKAICSREKTCNDFAFKTAWVDDSTCVARHKLALLDRLSAPGTGDTVTSFGLCAAAYPTFGCDKIAGNDVPGDCRPDGTVAKGAACAWHSQCASGFCARASDESCATCEPKPKAGDSCATVDDCGRGLLCVLDKCVKLGKKGEACDVGGSSGAASPCEPGLGCKVVGTATTGTCDAPIATGSECDHDEQCDTGNGFFCKDGPTSTDPSTCALLPIRSVGETCVETSTLGPAECKGGTSCYEASTTGGKCITHAAEGAACNLTESSSGPDCTFPAVCDSATSKCTLPTAKTCL